MGTAGIGLPGDPNSGVGPWEFGVEILDLATHSCFGFEQWLMPRIIIV